MIQVVVNGANGKMGMETVKAVTDSKTTQLVAALDKEDDLTHCLQNNTVDVVIDFTHPSVAFSNVMSILQHGAHAVVGTTGFSDDDLQTIRKTAATHQKAALIMPNFAIGAVLMMKYAAEAAKYMPRAEIIEYHHDKKADAPSGTAIKTAQLIHAINPDINDVTLDEEELIDGARGGACQNIPIHSVRLPGYVASQEVILGGTGQTLRFRHDTISRDSFMPGVILCCEKAQGHAGELVYGLENLL